MLDTIYAEAKYALEGFCLKTKKILKITLITVVALILLALLSFYLVYLVITLDTYEPSTNFSFAESITIRAGDYYYTIEDKEEIEKLLSTLEGRYSFMAGGGCPSSNVYVTIEGNNRRVNLSMTGDTCGFVIDVRSLRSQSYRAYITLRIGRIVEPIIGRLDHSRMLIPQGGNEGHRGNGEFRRYINEYVFPNQIPVFDYE